jgi:protein phosphatase
MTILRSGSATDVGRIRQVNQDLSLETPNLFAVADGMGGHAGGEVAARVAIESLQTAFDRQPSTEGLEQAVIAANEAVFEQGQAERDLHGMGTTLTAAALVAGSDGRDLVALANVGDSRAYLFSDGRLSQITQDHSLAEERVRRGLLSEEEAAIDPRRHILTRALGVSPEVDVDLWELHLRTGDRVLLCSDGLCNEVEDTEMAAVLEAVADPGEAAQQLVDTANEHGGSDNITVVVVDVLLGEGGAEGEAPAGAAPGEGGEPPLVVVVPPAAGAISLDSAGSSHAGGGDASSYEHDDVTRSLARTDYAPADQGLGGQAAAVATLAPVATGTLTEPPMTRPPGAFEGAPAAAGGAGRDVRRETRGERRRRLGIPRRLTFRVLFFFLLLVGILIGGYYAIRWYANDDWYVTLRGPQLVIYQGHPGGTLWIHPKLVDRTGVTTGQILSIKVPDLRSDVEQPSLRAARRYVANLEQEKIDQQSAQQNAPGGGGSPSGTLPTTPPPPQAYTGPPATSPPTTAPPAATTTIVTTATKTVPVTAPPAAAPTTTTVPAAHVTRASGGR